MIRSFIKKVFNSFGYEIRKKELTGIFAIRNHFEDALGHIKARGYTPDLIIDVGAAEGTPPLQKCFPASTFAWIEPLKEFEHALQNLQKQFKGDYFITAVGKKEGSFMLHVHKDLHGSTIFNETDGEDSDGTPRQIPVTTLNNLATKHQWLQFEKIILKADVQGYELEVMEGARDILSRVDLVILEVSLFRFLKQAPEFYDVIDYMKKAGFVLYDIVGGINRPLDFALGQKDLFFVKENGIFRQSHGWSK